MQATYSTVTTGRRHTVIRALCCRPDVPSLSQGTDLGIHPLEHLLAVEYGLNNCLRLVLDDHTPHRLFTALLASERPSVLRR
jgi:hypothetical protein